MQQPSMQARRVPEFDTDSQLGLEGIRLVEVGGIFGCADLGNLFEMCKKIWGELEAVG